MIDMKYKAERITHILSAGEYKGVKYWIVSMGTHPCAYIDVTDLPEYFLHDAPIHGGVTYDEDFLMNVWDEAFDGFCRGKKRFVGWDYAHAGDYIETPSRTFAHPGLFGRKKWTTEEILKEIKDAVNHGKKNIKKAKGK